MPDKWNQYTEDEERLPEGFKRIAYDSDTRRYTFRDREGVLYQGEPGEEYGTLRPVPLEHSATEVSRPSAFAPTAKPLRRSTIATPETASSIRTFQDILPPDLITNSSLSGNLPAQASQRSKMVDAMKKSTLPKMQGVVSSLRRSVTSMRRKPIPSRSKFVPLQDGEDSDSRGLIARDESASSLNRSASLATTGTEKSFRRAPHSTTTPAEQ
ncbi:hypothetical protein CPC08DRAFT_721383 [Agrocybe pediades]|nr:hypothetical protein CPC08DRAFT_721383 [Agrocybe pediades]